MTTDSPPTAEPSECPTCGVVIRYHDCYCEQRVTDKVVDIVGHWLHDTLCLFGPECEDREPLYDEMAPGLAQALADAGLLRVPLSNEAQASDEVTFEMVEPVLGRAVEEILRDQHRNHQCGACRHYGAERIYYALLNAGYQFEKGKA